MSASLTPVDTLVTTLLTAAAGQAPLPIVQCALADALGRVLAHDYHARVQVPPLDNSAMDGYAGRWADFTAAPAQGLRRHGMAYAGQAPAVLAPHTVMRIFTGAPIPVGADTVVMQENTTPQATDHGDLIQIDPVPTRGDNIRRAGQDVAIGQMVLAAGTRLGAAELGLLASVGCAEVAVYQRLRVAVLSTGDELVEVGQPLAEGQIHNSNGPLLCALVQQWGVVVSLSQIVADQPTQLERALRDAAACSDVILSSGGASVGDADHLKTVLAQMGQIDHWKLAIKPGKPLVWGQVHHQGRSVPLIGLPGNPQSVWVTALVVLLPYIKRLQGQRTALLPQSFALPAAFSRPKPQGRREYMRVQIQAGQLVAHPNQSSGVLSSAVWADGFACIEAGLTVQQGDLVPFLPFSSFL